MPDDTVMPGVTDFLEPLKAEPKPKMLFLDDSGKRLHAALQRFSPDFDVTLTSTVKECLRLMCRNEYDLISLDHDLNGVDFEDPDSQNCGMEVVRYLKKTGWPPNKKKPLFHIHSSNVFAAFLMQRELESIGLFAEWRRFEYPKNMYMRDFS